MSERYGTKITLRGIEYFIAPLTRRQVEQLWPKIVAVADGSNKIRDGLTEADVPAIMGDACEVILAGLRGGGSPDMALEYVETNVIDLANWAEAFFCCLNASGIRLVKSEPGKPLALAQVSPPTGSVSTGT
jgi:hypothetical protein